MYDWSEQEVRNELYEAIINKKGVGHQLTILIEELSELIQAITKHQRSSLHHANFDNIVEEVTDVEIMLEQLKLMIWTERIFAGVGNKLDYQLKIERAKKLTRLSLIASEN